MFLLRCNAIAHDILNSIQKVISSPLWFFGNIVLTVAWMLSQYVLPHPWDPPKAFFPFTVLVYTLLTQWIENAVKVQQTLLQNAQVKQDSEMASTVKRIEKLAEDGARRDAVLLDLINALDLSVDKLLDLYKKAGDK